MNQILLTSIAFSSACVGALAEDFSGKQFNLGAVVSVGSLLDCEAPEAPLMKRHSPKMFSWAISQGLVEQSAVTGTPTYTAKVSTKNSSGHTVLIVGCWVATEIVKETVDGKQVAFAKGTFKVNDVLRSSPLAELAVCKKKKAGPALYVQGDYRVLYEADARECKQDQWQDRLSPLSSVERETALFELRGSIDKKGYVRNVGW